MNSRHSIQYTIRGVQPALDKELRRMARLSGRSLNQVTLDVLRSGVNLPPQTDPDTSLDDLFGTLPAAEAAELNKASKEARKIHPEERY